MSDSFKQRVILYTNDAGKAIVYATAYDEEETRHQLLNCARSKGREANVRSTLAEYHPRED